MNNTCMCWNISTVINIKLLANFNQQTRSYQFTSHIAAFLSVVLITEMLEIRIQTSYDQNVQQRISAISFGSIYCLKTCSRSEYICNTAHLTLYINQLINLSKVYLYVTCIKYKMLGIMFSTFDILVSKDF
jgi:hypothetical protein